MKKKALTVRTNIPGDLADRAFGWYTEGQSEPDLSTFTDQNGAFFDEVANRLRKLDHHDQLLLRSAFESALAR